jgi:hypothetical protein
MIKHVTKFAIPVLASALIVGCAADAYKTEATDTQLSAEAGQAVYPKDATPTEAPHLFSTISQNGTITLYNTGTDPLIGFDLWVNQLYTIRVTSNLDAKSSLSIDPAKIYSKSGTSLKDTAGSIVSEVQIDYQGKLWNVQGPIMQK